MSAPLDLLLLGPVEVPRPARAFSSSAAVEVLAFLACHRRGADADQLITWVWPDAAPTRQAFNNVISRARLGLGRDRDGGFGLQRVDGLGVYRLSPSVATDIDQFGTLVDASGERSRSEGERLDLLLGALALVRGVPLTGGRVRGFAWADNGIRSHLVVKIDEVSHAAVDLALGLGRFDAAHEALAVGSLVLPGCEQCGDRRFQLAAARGSRAELWAVRRELEATASLISGGDVSSVSPWLAARWEDAHRRVVADSAGARSAGTGDLRVSRHQSA